MLTAGSELRRLRETLGMRMRDIEAASERISRKYSNEEYLVPISRLSDFETRDVIPSVYRMYSLAVIYRVGLSTILSLYGIDMRSIQFASPFRTSHLPDGEETSSDRCSIRAQQTIAPPVAGRYLLDLMLPRKHRESLVGDIEQEYRMEILPRYGRRWASIWFWKQVIWEIVPGLYLRFAAAFVKHLFWKAD